MSNAQAPGSASPLARRAARAALFVLIVLFALPILLLLLRGTALCTHDGDLHFYRLVALRDAIRQGLLFSRWTPGLVYGYGFPFFNFRELGSYYVPEILHLLGLGIPAAINVVYAGALLLSGWGAFLLARDIWKSETAGLVAAAAYMLAPYQLLDITVRGNLPESIALGLMPIIVWLFRRLAAARTRLTFWLATLSVAALLLVHNISSLLFIPMLVAYLVILFLVRHQRRASGEGRRAWTLVAVAMVIGIGLTAFSWLPAVAEKDSVQLYLTYSTRGNDFRNNFVTVAELAAPSAPADPTLLNPPLQVNVGRPQLGLGLLGLLGMVGFRRRSADGACDERWLHSGLLGLATLLLLMLALPLSAPLWERLPLIRFVQFPWRLVGRAALPLALLAGSVPAIAAGRPLRSELLTGIAVVLLLLAALPWSCPSTCSYPESPTIADVMDFERATGLTGVDPLGAYLPRWVVQRPATSPMEAALRAGTVPRRFDLAEFPAGSTVFKETYGPNRATIELESPVPFQVTYHTFYFPGWVARVDGAQVSVEPTAATGLISFAVPSGRHTLSIRWELTPLRTGAAIISVTSLVLLAVATIWAGGRRLAMHTRPHDPPRTIYLVVLTLAVLAFKWVLVDPGRTPLRRARLVADTVSGLQHPMPVSYADGLELVGYEATSATAGAELRVDLAWTVYQRPAGAYASRLAVVDDSGLSWSAKETYRPRGFQPPPSTAEWLPGAWAWDSHSIPVLPGTPPGLYLLKLTVFERNSLAPLNVLDQTGRVAGPDVVIGELMVERPPDVVTDLDMQYTFDLRWGDLILLGANLDRAEAMPGEPTLITLFWQANGPLPELTALLRLQGPSELTVREWHIPLIRDDYPPTLWRTGDGLTGQHLLQIPGRAQDGRHSWQLVVLDTAEIPVGPPIELGELVISAPERLWDAPTMPTTTDIMYSAESGESFARLAGYALTRTGSSIELTLLWHAEGETDTSYRVYVHLLAPDRSIAAQSDSVPSNWTRPTASWAPGEYVMDSHTLTLPDHLMSGEYVLAIGFYDLATGDRLTATQDVITELNLP